MLCKLGSSSLSALGPHWLSRVKRGVQAFKGCKVIVLGVFTEVLAQCIMNDFTLHSHVPIRGKSSFPNKSCISKLYL